MVLIIVSLVLMMLRVVLMLVSECGVDDSE